MYKWDVNHVLRFKYTYVKNIVNFVNYDITRLIFNKVQFYFYNCDLNNIIKHKLKNKHDNNFVDDNII